MRDFFQFFGFFFFPEKLLKHAEMFLFHALFDVWFLNNIWPSFLQRKGEISNLVACDWETWHSHCGWSRYFLGIYLHCHGLLFSGSEKWSYSCTYRESRWDFSVIKINLDTHYTCIDLWWVHKWYVEIMNFFFLIALRGICGPCRHGERLVMERTYDNKLVLLRACVHCIMSLSTLH